MGKYEKVVRCVAQKYGFTAHSCWIADVLEMNGLKPRPAYNRKDPNSRSDPCPPNKRSAIEDCLKSLQIIK